MPRPQSFMPAHRYRSTREPFMSGSSAAGSAWSLRGRNGDGVVALGHSCQRARSRLGQTNREAVPRDGGRRGASPDEGEAWPLLGGVGAATSEIRFPDGGRPGPCPCDRLQDWKRDVSICLNLTRFDFHVSMIDLFARTAEGSRKRVSQGRWSRVVLLKPKHLGFRN